ncbi:MAG: hypothetical protein AAF628_23780 [Planctomycetota bacterium]
MRHLQIAPALLELLGSSGQLLVTAPDAQLRGAHLTRDGGVLIDSGALRYYCAGHPAAVLSQQPVRIVAR